MERERERRKRIQCSVAMAESWRGGGTLIFNFSTTSLWALGRAHTRVFPPD